MSGNTKSGWIFSPNETFTHGRLGSQICLAAQVAECHGQCFPFCRTDSEKQNPAMPRDLSASGCFQTLHTNSRENCIYTSGKWKSYIHLSTREEIFACLALADLSASFQIAEGKWLALRRESYCRGS